MDGNEFIITVRNLETKDIKQLNKHAGKKIIVPNLFGVQRFGKNNQVIGKLILKRDFKNAISAILENTGQVESKIRAFLTDNKNNYIEAIRLVPIKTRKLFVHSYQSFLFNNIILQFLKKNKDFSKIKNIEIPIIGFNFEIESIKDKALNKIIKKMLSDEKINTRDFVINQMPELTSEGTTRKLFFDIKDLKVSDSLDDELNEDKKKVLVEFTLPKSCYATTFLEFLLQ